MAYTKEKIAADLDHSTQELLQAIKRFPGDRFNTVPPEGGWSAGQVCEHLIKVETGTVRLFSGKAKPADRDPEKKIDVMKKRLLDFDNRMTASGPIIPNDDPKDKVLVLNKLQDIRQRLRGMIEIQDLTKLIKGFGHPLFGHLTRIEWICFNIYHSERHVHQIETIKSQLQY